MEKIFFLTLEFDDDVTSYQEQPQITIDFQNRTKIYSADCFVRYTSDSNKQDSLIEVKYTQELEKKREYFEEKFTSIQEACKELAINFSVFTEQQYSQTYIDNIDFLYRYKTHDRESHYDEQILSLCTTDKLTASELANNITTDPKELIIISNAIWGLVAIGKLRADLYDTKVSMNSFIELSL
ncbi:TnsA endonuclease N-terminal domain-containing protein [Sulfurimonas sp. NW9]|uniref:TnsA endonuclease N-terminal domain-containing protein n=1 Tax=Sulfurimonas sp. NW9 TaxID=2922728 RepID=UPI003DA9A650